MKQQLTIILTVLIFVACQNNKTENHLAELEKFIIKRDSLTSKSKTIDQLINFIQTKKTKFKQKEVRLTEGKTGVTREVEFSNDFYTSGKYKDRIPFSLRIKEYTSERQAAVAFQKIIEFYACCNPDEDIVKLKNFENLEHFKNSASTTILSENIIIELIPANQTEINEEISELLDKLLKERQYLKLEIGHGGPAIWTRK